jgi:hypothetical protein
MVLTAKEWGWSPTALLRGAEDPHKHHEADYNVAHAVETLLAEKCPRCGVPTWHAYYEGQGVGFEEDEHECYACMHQEEQKAKRKDKPGVTYTVRAVPLEDYDKLPTRDEFYEYRQKRAIAKAARELEEKAAKAEEEA